MYLEDTEVFVEVSVINNNGYKIDTSVSELANIIYTDNLNDTEDDICLRVIYMQKADDK